MLDLSKTQQFMDNQGSLIYKIAETKVKDFDDSYISATIESSHSTIHTSDNCGILSKPSSTVNLQIPIET